jgi:hypothetical protein
VLLQGFALLLMPFTARVIHTYNPRWALGAGFLLIGIGDLWIATVSVADLSIVPIVAPLVLVGIGFAFALSGVTAVAVTPCRTTSPAWPRGPPASCATSASPWDRR